MRIAKSAFSALLMLLSAHAYGGTTKPPDIKVNPNPRMRYEITVEVKGAPGPFDRIEGVVDYRVANEACVPMTPVTGATVAPEKRVPISLTANGNGIYKGEIYADLLQDEDYFGKGICHWSVVAASANLFVKNVDFSAPLFRDDLLKGKSATRYYSNRSYATTHLDRVDVGEDDPAKYQDEAKATFSITVRAEENRSTAKRPEIKLNQTPRMRYEIVATVEGAPGPFERIEGSIDYKVTNGSCVPLTPISGATVEPQTQLPVVFERVGENTFKGEIYVDRIQDEDYFGMGVCHWSVVGASADFHHGEVNFSPAIYHDDIVGQRSVVRYFSERSYDRSSRSRIDIGSSNKSDFTDAGRLFSITLKSMEKLK